MSIEEIEKIRERIIEGSAINIELNVFKAAEEAYSAVKSKRGPKLIQSFAKIPLPIIAAVLLITFASMFF